MCIEVPEKGELVNFQGYGFGGVTNNAREKVLTNISQLVAVTAGGMVKTACGRPPGPPPFKASTSRRGRL